MDIRATRSAVATRSPEARATRNRITFRTAPTAFAKPVTSGAAAQNSDVAKHPPRVLFVAGDSMHTQLIRMVLSKHDMIVTALTHARASSEEPWRCRSPI